MAGGRIGEDHATVTNGGDHETVRAGQLGTEGSAYAPAQSASGTEGKVGARLRARAGFESQLIFVENQSTRSCHFGHAAAQIFGRDVRGISCDAQIGRAS